MKAATHRFVACRLGEFLAHQQISRLPVERQCGHAGAQMCSIRALGRCAVCTRPRRIAASAERRRHVARRDRHTCAATPWPRLWLAPDRRFRTHQDCAANCGTVEDRAPVETANGRLADQAPCGLGIASGGRLVLRQQPKAIPKLDHMVRARIGHREPTAGAQHPRSFRKIFRGKDADYEIDGGILRRPFGPQIGDGKCEHRPRRAACRAASLEISRPIPMTGGATASANCDNLYEILQSYRVSKRRLTHNIARVFFPDMSDL
jgi:hypothetical protein